MPLSAADDGVDPPRCAFFHGTKGTFRPGEMLRPRREHGAPPTTAPLTPGGGRLATSDDYVYVTRRYLLAWAYAHKSGGDGEPVVLLVKPEAPVEPDPEHSVGMWAYRCPAARVVAVDDRVPISPEVADRAWKQPGGLPSG